MLHLSCDEIMQRLETLDLIAPVESALEAYSNGSTICPPPGEMLFDGPQGEVHIKFGYIIGQPIYVVKVASGFAGNSDKGVPTSDGLMLVFSRETGEPVALLEDRGRLTDFRTAAAGAVAAKYLAPERPSVIGILGAGIQAELQVRFLRCVRPFENIVVWARRTEAAKAYVERLKDLQIPIEVASTPSEVASRSDLIITATASRAPLLDESNLKEGLHITGVGADSLVKHELGVGLIGRAGAVVVDSRSQCAERGDLAHALVASEIQISEVTELGEIVGGARKGRQSPDETTICLLTGLAVQDVAACGAVLHHSA